MRNLIAIALVSVLLLVFGSADTMACGPFGLRGNESGGMFKYLYQWMRDDDGDGIPNGLDPDWTRPEDGTGYGKHKGDGSCSDDCDGTQDRIQERKRIHTNDGDGSLYNYRFENKYRRLTGK